MDPAFFGAGDLFRNEEDEAETGGTEDGYVVRDHSFPGLNLKIQEFLFHQVNANLLWPGACIFAQWLVDHQELLRGRRALELGSGTGALAIYLKKALSMNVTTCDYDDEEIEKNITHNCALNGISPLPHIRHTWGDPFPVKTPTWNLILASDILLYVSQYKNLIKTLRFLLLEADVTGERPCFIMSWRRRIPKEDEKLFFDGCIEAGLRVKDLGSRVYCIDTRGS